MFDIRAEWGTIVDYSTLYKFGHNESVGTSWETLWSMGGLYSYLTSSTILKISSADANDTSDGTGANTVQIYGLDSNYDEINETITLNGQTAVNSVNKYLRIYRMIIRTAGSGEENAGIIYAGTGAITSGVPAVKYASIDATLNQTLMSVYTIPNGKTGYLCSYNFYSDTAKALSLGLFLRPLNEVFQIKDGLNSYQERVPREYSIPLKIDAKTDIELRAKAGASGALVSANFDIILV